MSSCSPAVEVADANIWVMVVGTLATAVAAVATVDDDGVLLTFLIIEASLLQEGTFGLRETLGRNLIENLDSVCRIL